MEGRGEEEGFILVWLILGASGDDVRRSSSLALIEVEIDSGSAPAALTTAEELGERPTCGDKRSSCTPGE